MRWHKRLIAAEWTYSAKRVGRPGLMSQIKALIVRMATENPSWGCCRIQGEMKGLGHRVSSTTVANVLKENGINPAPDRHSSWRSFLQAHWGEVSATDFFTTEVWTPVGPRTYDVLFLIELKGRRVHIAGITANPAEEFMAQIARNPTDAVDGVLLGQRFLICDRDSKFTAQFKRVLKAAGVECVLTPGRAPNCNAFAERSVRSIKSECLNRMVFFGERRFREAVLSYIDHDHCERAHSRSGRWRRG